MVQDSGYYLVYEIFTINLVTNKEEVIREIKYLDEASSYRQKFADRIKTTKPDIRVYFRKKNN